MLGSLEHMALSERFAARNYLPLPVVLRSGSGAWVIDVDGRRYLDCLAGYSALNFGHCHPRILARAMEQLTRITLTSRAFHHDQFGAFVTDLARLTGKESVLPMNSGAEAVEAAVKVARRWGRRVKGVPENSGTIITMSGNFHGGTTSVVSFSTDETVRADFGPFTPGFRPVPYGNLAILDAAMTSDVVAVILEPIQGEAGVIIPPPGYLQAVRELCTARGVLMIADEIQSGLGRTGRLFACDHEQVVPDVYVLGKSLGGGVVPVSAVVADNPVMSMFTPGSHASTFGGNPLGCAVAHEVVGLLAEGDLIRRGAMLGERLASGLFPLIGRGLTEVRMRGLWAGIDVDPSVGTARAVSERLLQAGVLAKETQGFTLRLAPPLVISEAEIDLLIDALRTAVSG
ncbi:ornithine--oxo-acid transaminase [Austwickia sp. TVS 96-490-7B]|uniref:ornithine--oxo-acid transaminase n=1 Tax=Austwickia sp. TVS 96-490-7B TaxID=2830843 RepID=UPI001C57B96A|nr:ornithine--oxo-acid transaminase [Austwickia sp. TVS 96-490-7B]